MKIKEFPLSLWHSARLRYVLPRRQAGSPLPVVVSLTSIPSRLKTLDITIASLLNQSQPAQLIVLWLHESVKSELPSRLLSLQSSQFEIRYCEGASSYRKLLPSLRAFPNTTIVTCDDDMIYPSHWLANLYEFHQQHPNNVVSQVGRLISVIDNEFKEYSHWPFIREPQANANANFLPIGFGGVLYPIDNFNEQVFDETLFMQLSPSADDLWFKAMTFLNNKSSICAGEMAKPIPIIGSQVVSLNQENIKQDANRKQWQALCDYFPTLNNMA